MPDGERWGWDGGNNVYSPEEIEELEKREKEKSEKGEKSKAEGPNSNE